MVTNGVSKYFLQNHLGSTTALTNSSGSVIESATYDSFGNATGNLSTRYQFTGREFDNAIGLTYYRARWYSSELGRFVSEDPIGFAGGDVNLFGYVGNNSQNFVDPSGLQQSGIQFLPTGYFGEKTYKMLEEDFNSMKNDCDCRESFAGFGINLDDMSRKGILIGDGSALADSSIKSQDFRLTDSERADAIPHLGTAKAFTTFPNQTVDPRPHIFFNYTATRNGWGSYGDRDSLRENFVHELTHAGGIPGQNPGYFGSFFQHDLSYLNGYFDRPFSRLLSNCRRK